MTQKGARATLGMERDRHSAVFESGKEKNLRSKAGGVKLTVETRKKGTYIKKLKAGQAEGKKEGGEREEVSSTGRERDHYCHTGAERSCRVGVKRRHRRKRNSN